MQANFDVPKGSSATRFIMVINDARGRSLAGSVERTFSRAGTRHVDMGFYVTKSIVRTAKAGKKIYGKSNAYRADDRYVGQAKDRVALVDSYNC